MFVQKENSKKKNIIILSSIPTLGHTPSMEDYACSEGWNEYIQLTIPSSWAPHNWSLKDFFGLGLVGSCLWANSESRAVLWTKQPLRRHFVWRLALRPLVLLTPAPLDFIPETFQNPAAKSACSFPYRLPSLHFSASKICLCKIKSLARESFSNHPVQTSNNSQQLHKATPEEIGEKHDLGEARQAGQRP